jgi:hypothetical protein
MKTEKCGCGLPWLWYRVGSGDDAEYMACKHPWSEDDMKKYDATPVDTLPPEKISEMRLLAICKIGEAKATLMALDQLSW